MKGCICLDIDGTITADPLHLPVKVLEFFRKLYADGWVFVFATGRSFSFAEKALKEIDFPFYFALQNGADILQMPEKKQIFQSYISCDFIEKLESLYEGVEEDFIIYSGWKSGDFCYYRPGKFSKKIQDHMEIIRHFSKEPWHETKDYVFTQNEKFPLIKTLGSKQAMYDLDKALKSVPEVESTFIKDPITEGVYDNLITARGVTKGHVIRKMRTLFPDNTLFIAAGDDFNDVSMLQEVDISIVMETAPFEILALADIIAKPAAEMGIINALEEATKKRM